MNPQDVLGYHVMNLSVYSVKYTAKLANVWETNKVTGHKHHLLAHFCSLKCDSK